MLKSHTITDWSELNDNTRFSPIRLDYKKYLKDTIKYPHDERFKRINMIFQNDAKNYPTRPDVQKRNRARPTATANRLAFPIHGKYLTYNDVDFLSLLLELNQMLGEYDLFDPRLFVDHSKYTQWWPYIQMNPRYVIKERIEREYLRSWHSFLRESIKFVNLDDIKVYGHQNSTSGPPFNDSKGRFYDAEDVYYGVDRDIEARNLVALRKNFTFIKMGFYPLFELVFEKQLRVAQLGGWLNYKGDLIKAYLEHILPTSVAGYRFNSIDKVTNASKGVLYDLDYIFETKDRVGTVLVPDGCITGIIDTKSYSLDLDEIAKKPAHFAVQRAREVEVVGWVSQVPAAVGAQLLTRFIEHSVNGFASTQPYIISGYDSFLDKCRSYPGGKFFFLNGDRSNAETYVTTNFEIYQELILPELRELYKVQTTVVKFRENNIFTVEGLNSGCGRTTELNWYAGTHEALYTIAKITGNSLKTVADLYFHSVLNQEPFFELPGLVIKLFMCTDDIPLVIYSYKGFNVSEDALRFSKDRMMNWDVSTSDMNTFGMSFSDTGLKPAEQSIIAKLFYSEHPGFYVSDCYSFYAKMLMLPIDLRRDIYHMLTAKFGKLTNEAFYADAKKAFFGWLEQFNIPISEVVDIYSPSGKIIYGEAIQEDKLFESSRVGSEYLEPIYNIYKHLIQKGENYD